MQTCCWWHGCTGSVRLMGGLWTRLLTTIARRVRNIAQFCLTGNLLSTKANKLAKVSTMNVFRYLCWGPTAANSTETQNCPSHVIGYDERLEATKRCTEDGTWWTHPKSNKVWTNYTACINQHDYGVIRHNFITHRITWRASLWWNIIISIFSPSLQISVSTVNQ